jgi:hypothetical protein
MLRAFCDSIYATCGSAAAWDRAALSYDAPKHAGRPPGTGA